MKIDKLGWVVAAALAGAMVGVGFQPQATKTGTVDMRAVLDRSNFATQQNERLRTLQNTRTGVLEYLQTYRAVRPEDAQRFRDLSVKDNPTAADKQALETLKTQIQADDQKFKQLQTKPNPTPEETAQLQEYNRRATQVNTLTQRWAQEFEQELAGIYGKLREDAVARVKASVNDVAKQQGYTMVFDSQIAPFSTNDITEDAIRAMNARR